MSAFAGEIELVGRMTTPALIGQVVDVTTNAPPDLNASAEAEVVVDRLVVPAEPGALRERLSEAVETCYRFGAGHCRLHVVDGESREFTNMLRCGDCDVEMPAPSPQLFSFNSPLGACERCTGYGATIDVDPERVVAEPTLTLRQGAIQPWSTKSTEECLEQLIEGAPKAGEK